MKWNTIESAPLNKELLIYCGNRILISVQLPGLLGSERKWTGLFGQYKPTHWMPLPEEPK